MAGIYKASKYKGVRFREHETRKNGIRKDRYFTIRYKINGKSKEEGVGWESEGFSELKSFKILCDIKENIKIGKGFFSLGEMRRGKTVEQNKEIIFNDFFNQYISIQCSRKSLSTVKTVTGLYNNHIKQVLGDRKLREIRTFDILLLQKKLIDEKCSASTINLVLYVISNMYNEAIKIDIYDGENPAKNIKLIKKDNARVRYLTKDEADLLLENLKNLNTPYKSLRDCNYQKTYNVSQIYEIALTGLYCGLRASEIFNICVYDVNFSNNFLTIRETKTKQSRSVPMPEKIVEMFKRRIKHFNKKNSDYIFHSVEGTKIENLSLSYRFVADKLFNKGINDPKQKVVFHTLRHTYASWLVMKGVDLYTVQKLLGHKDLKMTQRYAHLSPNKFTEAIKVLDN